MSQITIQLNGRTYSLLCGEGEEERLLQLAAHVGEKLESVIAEHGQAGDARLLLMTALLIADELFDAREGRNIDASSAAAAALRDVAGRAREPERPNLRTDHSA